MPTGGVNVNTAAANIEASAVALGVGSELVDSAAIARGEDAQLTERASSKRSRPRARSRRSKRQLQTSGSATGGVTNVGLCAVVSAFSVPAWAV